MIRVTLLTTVGCERCIKVRHLLDILKQAYPELIVQEVDSNSITGQDVMGKYQVISTPAIIINGKYHRLAGYTEKELRKEFDAIRLHLQNI